MRAFEGDLMPNTPTTELVAVVGLGYVGLPVALAFASVFQEVTGFDISAAKIASLCEGRDPAGQVSSEYLQSSSLRFTSDPADLRGRTFFVVCVPTPINLSRRPDLNPLIKASELIGDVLSPGAVVVYESTVYPGVTEEICGPILEKTSGLKRGRDFKLGYSPERINPGDEQHTLERTIKVVSGEDTETLERVASAYSRIVKAGIHRAPSIKVAEAAKVIENTQRDLNIALMNELALIFDRMDICTSDVLEAAGTKWNFLQFSPGLVGGHCIGVDPYYLTAKAEELGYHPQIILAGRRINDGMGSFVAQRLIKLLTQHRRHVAGARVAVLGLTFKENVPDIRNSRVPDIIAELRQFGIEPLVFDPHVSGEDAEREYGIQLAQEQELTSLDAIILAVPHRIFLASDFFERVIGPTAAHGAVVVDIKSAIDRSLLPKEAVYWRL